MKHKSELPEDLCKDEAVCFIADRHHVTPYQLLCYFFYGESAIGAVTPVMAAMPLEPNEIEILKGLSEKPGIKMGGNMKLYRHIRKNP